MNGWSTDLRSGFDVRKAGVGLTAAGGSAEVSRDTAIYRGKKKSNNTGSINPRQTVKITIKWINENYCVHFESDCKTCDDQVNE